MTQIKVFSGYQYGTESIENEVNKFLLENKGRIILRDIKYVEHPQKNVSNGWHNWTVMVVYDLVEES